VDVDVEAGRIQGKESKRILKVGDPIRARIVAVSLNELSSRESKIGLTMRQPTLGAFEWLQEKAEKKEARDKGKDQGKEPVKEQPKKQMKEKEAKA
jgi:DNA-directed RNA polymerase subunit E'